MKVKGDNLEEAAAIRRTTLVKRIFEGRLLPSNFTSHFATGETDSETMRISC
jgi:hypothetical protein